MSWKDWSYKKRGIIVGVICAPLFTILDLIFLWSFLSGIILRIMGLDLLYLILPKKWFWSLSLLIITIIIILFCGFIGLIFDKKESWKKKIVVIVILLLIFTPLSTYSHYLKNQDEKILNDYGFTEGWNLAISDGILTEKICNQLSDFNIGPKYSCYAELAMAKNLKVTKSLCDKLRYTDKVDCYFRLSTETGKFNHCNSLNTIEDESTVRECYILAAKTKNDTGICKIMMNNCQKECEEFWIQDCIYRVTGK